LPEPGEGRPEVGAYVEPWSEGERAMARIWGEVLGLERVGVEDNFFELGGDSILSIQVVSRARRVGLEVTPRQVFQNQTVRGLVRAAGSVRRRRWEQGLVEGEVEATPIQRWFLEQEMEEASHYNQSQLLEVREGVGREELEEVLRSVMRKHDMLRVRFEREGGGWRQEMGGMEVWGGLEEVDLSGVSEEGLGGEVEGVCEGSQGGLEVEGGRLVRAVLMELGGGRGRRLLVVVHHLLVDVVSWGVLLEDLERGCEQVMRGEEVELGEKTMSYAKWSRELREWGRGEEVWGERGYWEGVVGGVEGEWGEGELLVERSGEEVFELGEEETRRLQEEVGRRQRGEMPELLLSGLLGVWERERGGEELRLWMEGHGREEVEEGMDVTRTVGWFTSLYPLRLGVKEGEGEVERLRRVKEEVRGVPRKGIGYGVLRYLREGGEGLSWSGEVSFNYLGQAGRGRGGRYLVPGREGMGSPRGGRSRRVSPLEVNAAVVGGRLRVMWTYSRERYGAEEVRRLGAGQLEELRRLVEVTEGGEERAYVPSDFPSADLDAKDLARLLDRLKVSPGNE
jgi:non-ribosomal peptide synthase protein (TIGR01720 family)